ncbi:arginine synthesis PII-interacting regulator PirA [Leptolyngbya sp. NIES-2104]|uniref:arginine synthesis PII-interacting regulator PirA n=1 Tax=Leptolyngbya sp. NIES-2104 TaxID=1552121 RepID=UPI0006EC51F4|nr:DUF4278 domain-containing protein [Leptolyngbya sp. NIES-2104]GAP97925.1 hypothetical protein NIES2104_44780 [Leptolyngbya sp. NIES-2104]
MRLIYRGVEYEYDPTQGTRDDRFSQFREPITLTYRGNRYQLDPNRPARSTVELQPRELIYRGNRYWVGYPDGKPMLTNATRSQPVATLNSTHRENLQRNLQRRIEIARQKGDNALLTLLEAERRQIA